MKTLNSNARFFACLARALLLRSAVVLLTAVSTSGCAREPELVSISATTFNYSQDYLLEVLVNGKTASSLAKPAKLGEIKGSGVFCCVSLSPTWRAVEVKIRAANKDEVVSTYVVQAKVRLPWPAIASYAVVHVLPSRNVVIEISPTYVIPEPERLGELEQFVKETK